MTINEYLSKHYINEIDIENKISEILDLYGSDDLNAALSWYYNEPVKIDEIDD